MKETVRIGAGAGFSGDRIEPAVILAERGALDYLVFECLAERTVALAVRERARDPEAGFDPYLDERMAAVLPAAVRGGVRIISNMGAANPVAAARRTAAILRGLGLRGLKVAAVTGDDLLAGVRSGTVALQDLPGQQRSCSGELISANAYLGCAPIVAALTQGADIVITGRMADPSLFLGPMAFEFGWSLEDWRRLGQGTVVGHLLECAGQVTGGYFADPPYKVVPGLADLGFPLAEVSADGTAVITKVAGTGGQVSVASCKEQLLYELHDPTRYITPDVIADFSAVRLEQVGADQVGVSGGKGGARPALLKVSLGHNEGYSGEGLISYAGPGALERGLLAREILEERLRRHGSGVADLRCDLIGVDAVSAGYGRQHAPPAEVRVRVVARSTDMAIAARVGREVEAMYTNGPAGGGGAVSAVRSMIVIESALVSAAAVQPAIHWEES
jgi:hypothetical protein